MLVGTFVRVTVNIESATAILQRAKSTACHDQSSIFPAFPSWSWGRRFKGFVLEPTVLETTHLEINKFGPPVSV